MAQKTLYKLPIMRKGNVKFQSGGGVLGYKVIVNFYPRLFVCVGSSVFQCWNKEHAVCGSTDF